MSTRASRGAPPKVTGRISQRKKMVLDVDLNAPACETCSEVGASSHASSRAQQVQHDHPPLRSQQFPDGEDEVPPRPMPIDVDSIVDDDVVFSSPTAFAEAKTNSRRNRGRTVVDVDSEESRAKRAVNARNKRQRLPSNLTVINCESYVNLESGANNMSSMMPPPPPPPKEPTFSCPVCMGPLVEEMSTKCGHIFCKGCIKAAIAAQGKCPTCRRKVTMKDTIRIYLPATS